MQLIAGLWYPDGVITKALRARVESEEFYRADRFHDAMRHVRQWRGAIDCGAHVGAWSTQLAKRFQSVISVEPNPDTVECLRRNLEQWSHARVIHAALAENGEAGGNLRINAEKGAINSGVSHQGIEVPTRELDDVSAFMEHVDYLKIHVNGYELPVLNSAKKTLRKHHPVVTVVIKKAIQKYGNGPQHIFDFMEKAGYRVASRLKPYWVFV